MFERFNFGKREDRPGDEKLNKGLVIGWFVIAVVLMIAYLVELIKGDRDGMYYLYFSLSYQCPGSHF